MFKLSRQIQQRGDIKRFSFERRKVISLVISFALTALHDWLKFFLQSEVKPKPIVIRLHTFSRA